MLIKQSNFLNKQAKIFPKLFESYAVLYILRQWDKNISDLFH